MASPRIIILGAGPAGLLIAQGLKKAGIDIALYERSTPERYAARPRDWSISLHWGSEAIPKCLPAHLSDRLGDCQADPELKLSKEDDTRFDILNGATGEVVINLPIPTMRRVVRNKFVALCGEGLDCRYGKEASAIELGPDGKVEVAFTDGTTAHGDAVVGCDGANSFVRKWLVGSKEARLSALPVRQWNFVQSFDAEKAEKLRSVGHPVFKAFIHPRLKTFAFISYTDALSSAPPETWKFQLFASQWVGPDRQPGEPIREVPDHELDMPDPAERIRLYKELVGQFCEPLSWLADWIPDDAATHNDRINQWTEPVRWDSRGGRVTLAGDAAHPMSSHRAQGLNNSLEDAARYVESVVAAAKSPSGFAAGLAASIAGDGGAAAAAGGYDDEVFTRGSREISISAEQTKEELIRRWQTYRNTHFQMMGSTMATKGFSRDTTAGDAKASAQQ